MNPRNSSLMLCAAPTPFQGEGALRNIGKNFGIFQFSSIAPPFEKGGCGGICSTVVTCP